MKQFRGYDNTTPSNRAEFLFIPFHYVRAESCYLPLIVLSLIISSARLKNIRPSKPNSLQMAETGMGMVMPVKTPLILALYLEMYADVRITFGSCSSWKPSMNFPSLKITCSLRNSDGKLKSFARFEIDNVPTTCSLSFS